jgi:carbamoyltransferase
VLREHEADWFELDGDVPYMVQVYPIRAEKRPLIPAATHADGTGRLQTVTAADNGVPMVLNARQPSTASCAPA